MNECYVFQNAPLGHPDASAQKAVLAMNSPTRPHVTHVASRMDPLLSLGCLCLRFWISGRGEQAKVLPQASAETTSPAHSSKSQSHLPKNKCSLQS